MKALELEWRVHPVGGGAWEVISIGGDLVACDILFGAYADHIVEIHNAGLPNGGPKHMQNYITARPVCADSPHSVAARSTSVVDDVSCIDCLRRLAKDAVRYGNGRKARRSW